MDEGVCLLEVSGIRLEKITILGESIVKKNVCKITVDLGADVKVLDI